MNKKIAAMLAIVLAVGMLFGACAPKQAEETATASASPEATASGQVIVAQVNGDPIYYDQYHALYANACASYGIEEDDATNGSYLKDMIIQALIDDKVMSQKLTENGYMNLTDEQVTQAEKNAQDYLDSSITNYYDAEIKQKLGEGYTDEQYQEAKAPYEQQIIAAMGYTTKQEFVDYCKLMVAKDAAKEKLVGSITPTEEEVQAQYDESVAADKESMEANPASYESSAASGVTVYYVPAGVRQVLQVLIKIDDEWLSAIQTLRQAGNTAQADYLLEKAQADIKGEADDVLDKIKSGSITFADAVTTYNDDTGMPATGYAVVSGGTTFVEPFTTAAMGLKAIGDISDLVPTDYGYHILQYVSDIPAGAVSYDSVRQEVYDKLLTSKQDEAWQAIVDDWTKASKIEKFEDKL